MKPTRPQSPLPRHCDQISLAKSLDISKGPFSLSTMLIGDSQNSSYADYPYRTKKDSDHKLVYQSPSFATKDTVPDELTISLRVCNKQDPRTCLLQSRIVHISGYFLDADTTSYRWCQNRCLDSLETSSSLLSVLNIKCISSGQSSPPSSIASSVFSPVGDRSSSSRSPESSQDLTVRSPYLSQRQPRIQVSSLLSDPFVRTYHLDIIQHPLKTAEFGRNTLSRLPLTPPIIARLTVRDSTGNSVVPEAELPFLIAHLSLFSGDGSTSLDMGSSLNNEPPLLYGNLVSSIDQLEDLQGNMGLFFIFPDASIRWRGRFQLRVTVMKICKTDSFGGMGVSDSGVILAEARTRPFDVLPYSQYAAAPRTRLTTSFIRQGARMFTFLS